MLGSFPNTKETSINKIDRQLILEQHRFELHGSTHMQIFSIINTMVLHSFWSVESMGTEC